MFSRHDRLLANAPSNFLKDQRSSSQKNAFQAGIFKFIFGWNFPSTYQLFGLHQQLSSRKMLAQNFLVVCYAIENRRMLSWDLLILLGSTFEFVLVISSWNWNTLSKKLFFYIFRIVSSLFNCRGTQPPTDGTICCHVRAAVFFSNICGNLCLCSLSSVCIVFVSTLLFWIAFG